MNHSNQRETVDKMLGILADQYCRTTLLCFQKATEDVISVRDLATRIPQMEKTDETILKLHHSTLPRLTDAGLIEYDSRSETVRYRREPLVEMLLDMISDCFPEEDEICEVGA